MERKKKVPGPDGQMVEGTELSFQSGGEHWNEYMVDDGSVIRLKTIVTDVVRIDGMFDQQGNPIYLVQSTNVMAVSAPEKLKRQGS